MMLRNQFAHERELRIQSENDAKMIRQQLADTLSEIHRDTTNLKKAISDMQVQNNRNLQTIYSKGDQNLQQMQQLEELSSIIRQKDDEIAQLERTVQDKVQENR